MAFTMPGFLNRFFRPFTTSMSRPLVPDSLAGQNFGIPTERAIFAGGCFWGLEEMYRRDFGNGKGLLDCRVGYTGGDMKDPGYTAVCNGDTGHAESLLIVFDPQTVSFRQLTEYFFKMHDPTTLNYQGADHGTQYRSALFATTEQQLKIGKEIRDKVCREWYNGKTITTEILMAGQWYDAEKYHQRYLIEKPGGYHCQAHYIRQFPPLSS